MDARVDQLRRPLTIAVVALLLTTLFPGCGSTPQPGWSDSADSPEALAAAVLDALASADEARLSQLALSDAELRDTVWPHLPASRDEVGMPWPYFWREHAQRNLGFMTALLARHGGQRYALGSMSFAGRTTYGDVTIHREPVLDIRTASGTEQVRLFGSMAERDGRWKLYSYVVD